MLARAAWLITLAAMLLQPQPLLAEAPSILIGLTAELQHPTSDAGQAIRAGIRAAIADINAAGGAIPGRLLELVERDDRGLPARSIDNFRELAAMPAMAGIFAGRSVSLGPELVKDADSLKTPLLIPWVGADNLPLGETPARFVFRLAITERDSLMLMFNDARKRGFKRIGLLLPSNAWGRRVAREAQLLSLSKSGDSLEVLESQWYEPSAPSLLPAYKAALERGAESLLLISNESDSRIILRELAASPEIPRLPLYLHWTAVGGRSALVLPAEAKGLDLSVVHPVLPDARQSAAVLERIAKQLPERYSGIVPVTAAALQAYDLTRLLGMAIARSGTGDRVRIRSAMLDLGEHRGMLKHYRNPYALGRNNALAVADVALFRLRSDGALELLRNTARR